MKILPPPYRVFWNWDIHYSCNYRCSYCFLAGKWEIAAKENRYPGANNWIEIWNRIYEKYGSCHIHFSGGEPFTYPDFFNLIIRLSEKHTLEFSTNLSFDVASFIEKMDPTRARLDASFHPEFAEFEKFLEKTLQLKNNGFSVSVSFVAYPPQLKEMETIEASCKKKGISFIVQPFRGEYKGRIYPEGYTESEKDFIRICCSGFRDKGALLKHYMMMMKKKKKKYRVLCRMGQMYAKIYACGDVYRCEAINGKKIGNLLEDKNFRLLDKPGPCENFPCSYCDGWRAMIVGKEEEYLPHWS